MIGYMRPFCVTYFDDCRCEAARNINHTWYEVETSVSDSLCHMKFKNSFWSLNYYFSRNKSDDTIYGFLKLTSITDPTFQFYIIYQKWDYRWGALLPVFRNHVWNKSSTCEKLINFNKFPIVPIMFH